MRLAPAFKYQMHGMKWPAIIYYIVIYALVLLFGAALVFVDGAEVHMTLGGMDGATIIFLFVVGLNSFKSTFHMLTVNGISRRTMFVSFVASAAALCAGMALIDSISSLIFRQFIDYRPLIAEFFADRYASVGAVLYGESFLWMFCGYLLSIMIGYFITTAFYRMNKPLKLIVSIGVPVFFLIVLPIIDAGVFSGTISRTVDMILAFCSGRSSGNPYVGMASDVVFAAIAGGLAYLLARRATVRQLSD